MIVGATTATTTTTTTTTTLMEKRVSRLFRTKRIRQSNVSCDNNNNEVGISPISNKNDEAGSSDLRSSAGPTEAHHHHHQKEISRKLKRMSNDELRKLLAIKDTAVLDCIIERFPTICKLENERATLEEQVHHLAYCNQSREPEFVRDRLKLRLLIRDVAQLVRQFSGKHLEPTINKLKSVEKDLARLARSHEEESETVAHQFLERASTSAAAVAAPASEHEDTGLEVHGCELDEGGGNGCTEGENQVQAFTNDYIEIRKRAIRQRTLADRLSKELNLLSSLSNHRLAPGTPTSQSRQASPVCRNVKLS